MLLEAQGLASGYGKLTILQGIDIAVPAGCITAVLGPNGAGKSTLMKTLAGHLPLVAGAIRLDDRDVSTDAALARARAGLGGYVPQEANVFPRLSVMDNLRAAALAFDGAEPRVDEVLSRFPVLAERGTQLAATLSGGERQTLAIATALIGAPKLLLLDEPTAGLAPLFVERIIAWVRELAEDGMGVLWVIERNPEKILSVSAMTHVMVAGRVEQVLASSELLRDGRLERVVFEMHD